MKLFDEIPVLEDDYLILHRMEEKDAPTLKAMCESEEVKRYLPTFLFEYQFEDKKEAITQMYQGLFERKESLLLGAYLKSDPDQMVGIAEYYQYEPNFNKVSIGGRIYEPYWHKGIGEHMISLQIDYAFGCTDIKRISAHIRIENTYSRQAIMRMGFRLRKENTEEDWGFPEKVHVDKFILEKLGNIHYVKIGHGDKTMVLLPGLAFKSTLGSADLIRASYEGIFKDYTVYVFDDRTNLHEGYTLRERAGDVAAEMKTLHLKNACVFGASMGGMVGLYLAIDHPELVGKLVLGSTCCRLSEESKSIISRWRDLVLQDEEEKAIHACVQNIYSAATYDKFGPQIEKTIGALSEEDIRQFVILCNAALDFDCSKELDKISCPVLVIGSEGDCTLFPAASREIAEKLGCEIHVYSSEYGHAVYDEAMDYKERMLKFFKGK